MNQTVLNHGLNNSTALPLQMTMGPQPSIYDHMHPNGVGIPKQSGDQQQQQQQPVVYLGNQQHLGMVPQSQYLNARNAAVSTES